MQNDYVPKGYPKNYGSLDQGNGWTFTFMTSPDGEVWGALYSPMQAKAVLSGWWRTSDPYQAARIAMSVRPS